MPFMLNVIMLMSLYLVLFLEKFQTCLEMLAMQKCYRVLKTAINKEEKVL